MMIPEPTTTAEQTTTHNNDFHGRPPVGKIARDYTPPAANMLIISNDALYGKNDIRFVAKKSDAAAHKSVPQHYRYSQELSSFSGLPARAGLARSMERPSMGSTLYLFVFDLIRTRFGVG
jgi:hypothetical protein